MGLLEKASNLEADEKEPETKVIKPKKEAPKETPATQPKKAAKAAKKPKVKKDEEPNKPKVSNTYGIAVNPLTGKMERTTQ